MKMGMVCDYEQEKLINIDKVTEIPREQLHLLVAEVIAEENLEYINLRSKEVKVNKSFYVKYVKRMFDIIFSALGIIFFFPLNVVLGILTFFSLGSPIFFREKRVGKDGDEFIITKFRNMTNEKDINGDLLPPNERVTRFGKIMRKTSLDELLNFYSIFKGDMSVIGPRPLHTVYMARYSQRHKMRNAIKPGLECPFINVLDHAPNWFEQFENDVFYVENVSFILDIKMMLALVKMVFDKKTRERNASAIKGGFMGYSREGYTINSVAVPENYVNKAIERYYSVKY